MKFDSKSIKILRCISRHSPLDTIGLFIYTSIESDDIDRRIDYLLSNGLIEIDKSNPYTSGSTMYKLTTEGEIELENESKYRRDHDFNEFRAWVTLLIAVIALILSIIK